MSASKKAGRKAPTPPSPKAEPAPPAAVTSAPVDVVEPAPEPPPPALTPAAVPTPLNRIRPWEVLVCLGLCLALFIPLLGSSGLWDPWETHYGEVARRMLEDHDWVRLKWQNENFRSKPVLTFWLMGAGMKLFGIGNDGGFSGEFISTTHVEWALRLPFALAAWTGGAPILRGAVRLVFWGSLAMLATYLVGRLFDAQI